MDFYIFGFLSAFFLGVFIWEGWTTKKEMTQSVLLKKTKTLKLRSLKDR